ncbi:Extracellular superoxide dismutase [Cu-Zn] [Camelus dromedarius]|uniref:Superoxide dismutase [Cu-Zn] n=1 Tax=Camelus dromedarius TaxID=9838 RepID=A0A5N4EFK7_CAMDR|nr:Extracellular superoxide dismutase [Cu-Zn] [Camelus dromedarius]
MLALLCAYLLMATHASEAWTNPDPQDPGFGMEEQIRDMHAKVTEIWQEMKQRRAASGQMLRCTPPAVLPSAALAAAQPRRAIHLHQFGDLTQGCDTTGPHYNPLGVPHPKHPGDSATRRARRPALEVPLRPERFALRAARHRGRAVVVHEGEDDLGRGGNQASVENGNAGRRLACCVVGLCGPGPWARQAQEHAEHKKRRRESECKTS